MASRKSAARAAKKLAKKAKALHRKRKYQDAVVFYEAALRQFASGQLYYEYGNSLSGIYERLNDSARAYDIAFALGMKRPYLAIYNKACIYARQNKLEKALDAIARAIKAGYHAFKYFERDGDLANLRRDKSWQQKLAKRSPKYAAWLKRHK